MLLFQLLLAIIYISFISLGLPDGLLGSAWPVMYGELAVPVSYAGIISMIIALGTVVSSLMSDRLTRKLGTGKITAISVGMTAFALFGFSVTHSFGLLCVWAIPYGLGAGSVDASLNNYVALHYESRHMSWLHCMWGIGAAAGPYVMGFALSRQMGWNMGYRIVSIIQICLTLVLVMSIPLWKERPDAVEGGADGGSGKALSLAQVVRIPGAKEVMICFFCYCALESTTGLWASSFLAIFKGIPAVTAASYAGLFYIGITVGRAISGFITIKLDDKAMVRLGQGIIAAGIIILLLPLGEKAALAGLVIIGLGCAPVYPCMIHSTPKNFGADKSQAIIGIQMASAYIGTSFMPPLFGFLSKYAGLGLYPIYLGILLAGMFIMHESIEKVTGK